VVFVTVGPAGPDRYYILTWRMLRDLIVKTHRSYLAKHRGVRPQRCASLPGLNICWTTLRRSMKLSQR
jgi:hypothetical protein